MESTEVKGRAVPTIAFSRNGAGKKIELDAILTLHFRVN